MTRTTPFLPALVLLLAACGGGSPPAEGLAPQPSPPVAVVCQDRAGLCADQLLNGTVPVGVDNSLYLPGSAAAPAMHEFGGVLNIDAASLSFIAQSPPARGSFPALSVQLMTVGDVLLPVDRNIISDGSAVSWDIILSPGKVWSETTDLGFSRASFPFTLVTNQWNEAHNGVATFLYDDTRVSNLHFQVDQETASWSQVSFQGIATASYAPAAVADGARIAQGYLDEVGARVEVKEWAELVAEYPGADLSPFTRDLQSRDISASGILVDNVLYLHSANTRRDAYPYPLEMRHGVFSVTKSAQAGLTMLRLAEKYGEQVFDLFVTDHVNVTATHNGWNGVTFGHLLNMVAGIGDNFPSPDARVTFADENDESSPVWNATWNTFPKSPKLVAAFGYSDYPWAPGQIVRYNTVHTFILGAALHNFYEAMEGPGVSVWRMMQDEVYEPIGIQVMPTLQTSDLEPIPIYGFGMFLNAYDTARITQLLSGDGMFGGQQILHRERTRQSLYKIGNSGFETFAAVPIEAGSENARYRNSFWSFTLSGPGNCTVRIPYMWGYGGNFVVILPNGISAFRYADANVHDPTALALATTGIRPVC